MNDPHAKSRDSALGSVLDGPGHTEPSLRHAVAENRNVPPDLAPLIAKIHAHAYRVTNEDVAAAQRTLGDDRLFEVIVSAAMGASRQRLTAGLAALEDA
jgi:hypothetical protein